MFVWKAISSIVLMIRLTLSLDSRIALIDATMPENAAFDSST